MRRRDFIGLASVAAAWPLAARSQQPANMYRIAIVHPTAPVADLTEETTHGEFYPSFFRALRRLGYIEGQNLFVERWTAEGRTDRYEEIAREVIGHKPDVVFVPTGRMALPFKHTTSTLPIVVLAGADPIRMGIVENLSRPGANITGVTTEAGPAFLGKHFQLLRDLKPGLKKAGFLAPRQGWEIWQPVLTATSQSMGISVVGPMVESPFKEQDHRASLASMIDDGIEGLVVSTAFEILAHRPMIVQLVQDHRLPAIYPFREYVNDGGLMSYTSDFREVMTGLAHYVDLILRGTKPGDLPYLQPTRFQFAINLKAARAIELNIPAALLASADELIE
ncbi:ABC transporter substrate-binding protein [Bradyrhizobium sp. AZCC 2289]|uniref:ABC transporter substrate-binding protein n=1 Tax=Bradyrhizobium sp. AZCC 2289 TaxID=3117026 RepID=UPI002FEF66AC